MTRFVFISLFLLVLAASAGASDAIITTVAGGAKSGFAGDGGPATAAQFKENRGIAFDSAGNLYVCDTQNHRIRKIDGTGIVTTIAGTGTAGFSGDGGAALSAQLNGPSAIAISGQFLLFCDEENHRVREIDLLTGTIQTAAGDGTNSFGGEGGPATSAQIGNPGSICIDSAFNIFIASGGVIVRVDGSTGILTRIAGSPNSQGFSGDGGPAVNATFFGINGLALDPAGNLIVVDVDNNRIRKIDTGGIVTTIAGTGTPGFSGDGGPALSAQLGFPGDSVAVDSAGNIYFGDYGADESSPRVRRIDQGGTITTVAGSGKPGFSGDGGLAVNAALLGVGGLAIDAAGDVFLSLTVGFDAEDGPVKDLGSQIRKLSFSNPDFVRNPDVGLSVEVTGRAGGLYQLAVNPDGIVSRAPFSVTTDFEDFPGRQASAVPGRAPTHQYIQAGIFVATSNATDDATAQPAGKARKTLAVSRNDTGESPLVTAQPASRGVSEFKMSGKFVFTEGKPDAVKFDGAIMLPAGLNLAESQTLSLGIGNVTDTVSVDPKGKATLPSAQQRIKSAKVKFPKPSNGTFTGEGQVAKVSVQFLLPRLDLAGFDTEGITRAAKERDPVAKSYPREIQVAFLMGGVTYELKAPVAFKLSSSGTGAIQGRAAKK